MKEREKSMVNSNDDLLFDEEQHGYLAKQNFGIIRVKNNVRKRRL